MFGMVKRCTCKVCGYKFKFSAKNRYEVAANVGVLALTKVEKFIEAFDCPNCGCQNIVNEREGRNLKKEGSEDYDRK